MLNLVYILVDGGETADDGAAYDVRTGVTLKKSATSADFQECEESSGKELMLTHMIIRSFLWTVCCAQHSCI